jgi:maltooligosyltrehalose trehalohydrolase
MEKRALGYWEASVAEISPGTLYYYRIGDSQPRPDPASNFQPEGVEGPSQVWDHADFQWGDGHWHGIPLGECILYEIHAGAFTHEGTLEAVASKIPYLKDLGINAIEILPVNQFPGMHNWGYDGVYPFAVQNTYGGPQSLKCLVNACHTHGIAVILDVVYNHMGPEGNYFKEFAPYFTSHYKTPWGSAINFDAGFSDQIRNFFFENALYWLREFHLDGLRLDAIHQIYDMSARHFLAELEERVTRFSKHHGRQRHLIVESDLNDPDILASRDAGGYGMHAQWMDDFQHCIDSMLRGSESPYLLDFGSPHHFVKANREGFVYSGGYSSLRSRRFGSSSASRSPEQFIVFIQNHDQVGNRPLGERFNLLVGLEAYKLAAGAMLTSPYIPMLFMGEEYAEINPFQFFADYCDKELAKAVCEGRKREFAFLHERAEVPDPCAPETFRSSKLNWGLKESDGHRNMLEFYRELIATRKALPSLRHLTREGLEVNCSGSVFYMIRVTHDCGDGESGATLCLLNFGKEQAAISSPITHGSWELVIDSSDVRWSGPGSNALRIITPGISVEIKSHTLLLYKRSDYSNNNSSDLFRY